MLTFKELTKYAKDGGNGKKRLGIVGNTSTQFLAVAVQGLAAAEGLSLSVVEAEYNQIEQVLLDKLSFVHEVDYLLLYLDAVKLHEDYLHYHE